MKIRQITIKNVTSYKEETVFKFDDRLNILIGPNGGGKSNLQKILAVILSNFFIHQYEFTVDDKEAKIKQIDLWTRRVLQRNLDHFFDDKSDQIIELELAPEESDIKNIKLIAENLDKFNEHLEFWESPYENYPPFAKIEAITKSNRFSYRIVNFELQETNPDDPAWAFREYLRTFFIFMRLANLIPGVYLTSPVFFFFSERTANRNTSIQTSQITDQNYYSGYRNVYQAAMGESTNLFQWGMQHFVKLWWQALNESGTRKDVTALDVFAKHPDVVSLDRYMKKLGYDWSIATDVQNAAYQIALVKDGHIVTAEKFSSGEREIVHFLLALFSLNVRDGLILVDEPELHLHPRWQRVFLELFRDLSEERNNQFVIATHSPVFVTQDTVNDIIRIFSSQKGSQRVAIGEVDLPIKKNLVRMINSQNNERLFFADKVVLVEGITDRIVFSSLFENIAARLGSNEAVEIIEVGGKQNFKQYRQLLSALKTPYFTIADQDYLLEVGSEKTKNLFVADEQKTIKALIQDKKSTDAKALSILLDRAIDEENIEKLREFRAYLTERHKRLRKSLTKDERKHLSDDIMSLHGEKIWILSEGEIEDYMPAGVTQLNDVVEMTEDKNWIGKVSVAKRRNELIWGVCTILGADNKTMKSLAREAMAFGLSPNGKGKSPSAPTARPTNS